MNKKALRIVLLAAAAVLVAGISVGAAMKLRASGDSAYKNKVLSKDTFELNGVTMYYVEPDEETMRRYPDSIIYKDDDELYYFFGAKTQELEVIDNKALDDKEYANLIADAIKPYPNTEELLEDAKERLGKWYDGDLEKFKWESRTDDMGDTSVEVQQVLNDEFSVYLAEAIYDMDGDFSYAVFNFGSEVNLNKKNNFLSKEEAIERAKAFLEEEYDKTDWEEITVRDVGGEQLYWEVKLKKTEIITIGYYVGVDLLTGEAWLLGTMR
ncbi:MAG: hypothetical protein NC223_02920 [Butyrivibrio sp.]|nr:hypothetical protein [Butyrivibrio sp.]